MQHRLIVHSAHPNNFQRQALVDGQEQTVTVAGLEVELVNEDRTVRSVRRFVPDDMAAALELYSVGATIISTDTPADPG